MGIPTWRIFEIFERVAHNQIDQLEPSYYSGLLYNTFDYEVTYYHWVGVRRFPSLPYNYSVSLRLGSAATRSTQPLITRLGQHDA